MMGHHRKTCNYCGGVIDRDPVLFRDLKHECKDPLDNFLNLSDKAIEEETAIMSEMDDGL